MVKTQLKDRIRNILIYSGLGVLIAIDLIIDLSVFASIWFMFITAFCYIYDTQDLIIGNTLFNIIILILSIASLKITTRVCNDKTSILTIILNRLEARKK